jgi:hypothetical protein
MLDVSFEADMTRCPLLHRKRTSDRHRGMSGKGQKQTHAPQQHRRPIAVYEKGTDRVFGSEARLAAARAFSVAKARYNLGSVKC